LVFVVDGSDYTTYLNAQQRVLIAVATSLAEAGVTFASTSPR